MKKFAILFIFFYCGFNTSAQLRWNSVYQSYIDQYKDLAIQEMLRYNIPASITLAQGLFESAAGRSELSLKGNNHFGIKCHGWTGRTVYHHDDEQGECFRAYDNVLESFEDHSKFLSGQQRYARLFQLDRRDYKGWANGLKACGYATNPRYADRLIEIIQLYRLYQYDEATHYDKFLAYHSAVDKPVGSGQLLHPISIYNKNYCIKVRPGDTFKAIGKEIGISYKKIAKYNERGKDDALQVGETIYLKKKQRHAEKIYKHRPHIVKAGESMYSIAQFYGIRLKSLYKMNHLSPDYEIRVGEALRVY
ncbi:glucosaminidase domain-containing protein [Prevotella sp. A2931]|uniref:Peptidoglycan hydrolase n=1 Tax=Prevotella illustrans TaxID=2800387 RepID=A0ABS3M898_9BACT|nr:MULTISPECIES: glucosaminidase domain-containing protein [Prevotella]MBO1364408.1 glucosaminidase domain-containing protein [Prevotella illustrans]PTL25547.1 N-acetylmuramoyl-L-alanine amidase [Prevotella sp. oral taxon 820]